MAYSVNLEIINDGGYGDWWDNTVIYKIQFIDRASTESNVSARHLRVLRAILFVCEPPIVQQRGSQRTQREYHNEDDVNL